MGKRLTGHDAIERAAHDGLTLNKYEAPTEGARSGLTVDEAREIAREDPSLIWCEASDTTWFAIGDIGAHEGFVTSRRDDDAWTGSNESGWTYQEVCGAHGSVLYEGHDEQKARETLDKWLECPRAEKGLCE